MDLDNNAHSVFLLHYHLILVVKYRRQVFDDAVSERAKEIFAYIESADKPCLIAIDEFQSISSYPEKNIEATLRTYIQNCHNANFVFAGSERTMMGEIFVSAARPFYQSVSIMNLNVIPEGKYSEFIKYHFEKNGRKIDDDSIHEAYARFGGVTWYIQKIMNYAYSITDKGCAFYVAQVDETVEDIVEENSEIYKNMLFLLTPPQKCSSLQSEKKGVFRKLQAVSS